MSDNVSYKDLGLNEILQRISHLDKTRLQVGVVGAKAKEPSADGRLTLGEVAIINQYGTGNGHVPPRNFMKAANDPAEVRDGAERITRAAVEFGNVEAAFDQLGKHLAEKVRTTIENEDLTANAEATIQRKGFDHPMVNTAELYQAIGHQVVRGSALAALEDDYYEDIQLEFEIEAE